MEDGTSVCRKGTYFCLTVPPRVKSTDNVLREEHGTQLRGVCNSPRSVRGNHLVTKILSFLDCARKAVSAIGVCMKNRKNEQSEIFSILVQPATRSHQRGHPVKSARRRNLRCFARAPCGKPAKRWNVASSSGWPGRISRLRF